MAEVEWTNEAVVELVEAYRARAELWDRTHELHAVQTAKYEAWSALARRFRCDIADLRKKMTSVLASYRREKGKIRGGARSSWFLYPRLHFLHGYLRSPPAPAPATAAATASADADYILLPHTGVKTENKRKTNRLRFQRSPPSRSPSPLLAPTSPEAVLVKREPGAGAGRVRRRCAGGGRRDAQAQLLGAVRALRGELARGAWRDECASFGQYIATALRKHDARAQACIKQAINNILFEQEMNRCSSADRPCPCPCPSPPPPLRDTPAPRNPLAD